MHAVERATVPDGFDVLARQLDAGVAIPLDGVRPTSSGMSISRMSSVSFRAIVALASTITPA